MTRSSGILLHVTSLPGRFGIGDLGPAAYQFVDLLEQSGQKVWQVLPLQPVDGAYGYSPYSSNSAFAGNRYLVSPEQLVRDRFIRDEDLEPAPVFPKDRVAFEQVTAYKDSVLEKAWQAFSGHTGHDEFNSFCTREHEWLDTYALFVAAKHHYGGAMWCDWPEQLRNREPDALAEFAERHKTVIARTKFEQFLFYKQWQSLKEYAGSHGVSIFGDIPIYVTYDSADTWASPQLFKLDDNQRPTFVAGVPPDYFSETGQLWGNPVYDWEASKAESFAWWRARLRHLFHLYDIVRIDHFRGLVAFWQVPADHETAVEGEWVEAPVHAFMDALLEEFGELNVVAEDLGTITDDVVEVMKKYHLPGMKVLAFAFREDNPQHPYLPENYSPESVVYTGTHDNNTILGWYRQETEEADRVRLSRYLQRDIDETNIAPALIETALRSRAVLAIFPLQDVLGLDESARMNTPGVAKGNWGWRVTPEQLRAFPVNDLRSQVTESKRS